MLPYWDGSADLTPSNALPTTEFQKLKALSSIPKEVVIDDRLFYRFRPAGGQVLCSELAQTGGATTPLISMSAPDSAFFERQLMHLRSYADLRSDRMGEIDVQLDDITSFFSSALQLDPSRSEWILETLRAVVRLCGYIEFPLKFNFNVARPSQLSTRVMPIIETPTHGSWPSGHATEAFAIATVLSGLLYRQTDDTALFSMHAVSNTDDKLGNLMLRIAMRIADNRVVAGVHYPHDGMAGAMLGISLGEALVNYLSGASGTYTYQMDAPATSENPELTQSELAALLTSATRSEVSFAQAPAARDELLKGVWSAAIGEMTTKA